MIFCWNVNLIVAGSFRTIHRMVYNALKLFMKINPDLFDESMQHALARSMGTEPLSIMEVLDGPDVSRTCDIGGNGGLVVFNQPESQ
jgi:hypothetical protein